MKKDTDKNARTQEPNDRPGPGGKNDKTRRAQRVRSSERRKRAARRQNIREELLLAGIRELSANGLKNFSVRRIAKEYGVSCATPYKHFQDREGYLAAIFEYISRIWEQRQTAVLAEAEGSPRQQLLATSLAYIRFLVENPHFRSIIMLKDDLFKTPPAPISGQVSPTTRRLINEYCSQTGMDPATAKLKTYIVRSLIYGASLMFDNGELPYSESSMKMAAYAIDREFDLPPAPGTP